MPARFARVALALAVLSVAALVAPAAPGRAHGVLEREREQIREERREIERRLDLARASDEEISAELDDLEATLAERRSEAHHLRHEADSAAAAVAQVQARVDGLRAEVAERERVLRARLADSYVHAGRRELAVFGASPTDAVAFARRQHLTRRVAKLDEEAAEALHVARLDLEAREEELARVQRRAEARAEQAEVALGEVEAVAAEKRRVHEGLQERIEHLREEVEALAREEERIQRILRERQQRDAAAAVPSAVSTAGFAWPHPGPVTSEYGPRWGRMHNGIDIGGGTGSPIRASKAGTVVYAGPRGGYGNLTIVDHGGGVATLYAHQSRFALGEGAGVDQGQVVGYVGCTGSCTGPHLHFEVRVDGSPRDPRQFLP